MHSAQAFSVVKSYTNIFENNQGLVELNSRHNMQVPNTRWLKFMMWFWPSGKFNELLVLCALHIVSMCVHLCKVISKSILGFKSYRENIKHIILLYDHKVYSVTLTLSPKQKRRVYLQAIPRFIKTYLPQMFKQWLSVLNSHKCVHLSFAVPMQDIKYSVTSQTVKRGALSIPY